MKRMNFLSIFFLFLVVSCQPKGEVKIETGGIFEKITFGFSTPLSQGKILNLSNQVLDLDEWDFTKGPLPITITVTNHSSYPYHDLNIKMKTIDNDDDDTNTKIRFAFHSGEAYDFPGYNGTCQRILAPNNSCTIKLELEFDREGNFHEGLRLEFKNLVNPEVHQGEIKILTGAPARLEVKDGGSTLIGFSEEPDSPIPLVERTSGVPYSKEVIIKNVGRLRARNFNYTEKIQTCRNLAPDDCASEFQSSTPEKVYQFTTDDTCASLKNKDFPSGAECTITITYKPKNTREDDLGDDEQATYRGGASFTFLKNPDEDLGSLNLNFESISSKIEGRLIGNSYVPSFGDVIQGRRAQSDYIVFNRGYRALRMKKIIFNLPNALPVDSPWGSCEGNSGEPYQTFLNCQSSDDEFPYRVEDINQCLKRDVMVNVDQSCLFKIHFYPTSKRYLAPFGSLFEDSDYSGFTPKIVFEYDSFWKGGQERCPTGDEACKQRSLKNSKGASLSGKRLKAARLVITKVTYPRSSQNHTFVESTVSSSDQSAYERLFSFDLGNVPLLATAFAHSKNYFQDVSITFKNTGDASATITDISDNNFNILFNGTNLPGTGFIQDLKTNKDCTTLHKNEECTLSFKFGPSGDITNANNWLFDDGDTAKGRTFTITYNHGMTSTNALGSDLDTSPELSKTQVTLKATLVSAGRLAEISTVTTNPSNIDNTVKGSDVTFTITHRNIGSGEVGVTSSSFGFGGASSTALNKILVPASLGPADIELCDSTIGTNKNDCRCRTTCSTIPLQGTNPLQSGDTCTLTYTVKSTTRTPVTVELGVSPFVVDNQLTNIHTPLNYLEGVELTASYNDCATGSGISRSTRNLSSHWVNLRLMKDPALIIPALDKDSNTMSQNSFLRKGSRKFYRTNGGTTPGQSFSDKVESLLDHRFIEPIKTYNPTQITSPAHDYHFFMGHFYSSDLATNSLLLKNIGSTNATEVDISIDTTHNASEITFTRPTSPTTINTGSDLELNFTLNNSNCGTSNTCTYQKLIIVKYKTGKTDIKDGAEVTCEDNGADFCENEIKILVTGTIEKSFPSNPFSIQFKKILINGEGTSSNPFTETGCSDTFNDQSPSVSPTFNQIPTSSSNLTIDGVQTTSNGLYAKTLLKITNNSGKSVTFIPSSFGIRPSPTDLGQSAVKLDEWGISHSNNCGSLPNCASSTAFSDGQSCFISLVYRPTQNLRPSGPIFLTMGLRHDSSPGLLLNIPFNLNLQVPAKIAPTSCVNPEWENCKKDIIITGGAKIKAFEFDVTSPILVDPNTTTPREFIIPLKANGTTTARLTPPVTLSYDDNRYATTSIFSSTDNVMKVYAHEDCFTGFSETSGTCRLKAVVDFSAKNLYRAYKTGPSSAEVMERENNSYYLIRDIDVCRYWDVDSQTQVSFCRSSYKESFILKFDAKPTQVSVTSHFNVSDSTKSSLKFTQPQSSLSAVVGYRIFQFKNSTTASSQNLFIVKPTTANIRYFDFYPSASNGLLVINNPATVDNDFNSYRIMMIRSNSAFNRGTEFGLTNANYYLNEIVGSSVLRVLTPGNDFIYLFPQNIVIDKSSSIGPYSNGLDYCSKQRFSYQNNSTPSFKTKEMIDDTNFNLLEEQYKNELHWINKTSSYLFSTVCPGFPDEAVNHLNCLKVNVNDTYGRMVMGPLSTIYYDPPQNYSTGYVSDNWPEAIVTRCITRLP